MTTITPRTVSAPDAIAKSLAIFFTATSATANVYYSIHTFADPTLQIAVAIAGVVAAYVATFVDYDTSHARIINAALLSVRIPAIFWSVTCAGYVVEHIWLPGIGAAASSLLAVGMTFGGCTAQYWVTNRAHI